MGVFSKRGWVVLFGLLAAGCSEAEPAPEPTTGVMPAAPATGGAARTDLTRFVGIWNTVVFDSAGDTISPARVEVTGDGTTWSSTFPGRDPIAMHVVAAAGDSVVLRSDPYASVLDPGVQVTSENVIRVAGDEMVGTWLSHRSVTGPDSVLSGPIRGARVR